MYHLLEIVEHEQQRLVPHVIAEQFLDRALPFFAEMQSLRDGRSDQVKIRDCGQGHEANSVGKLFDVFAGDVHRQARLSTTAGAGHRHKPDARIEEQGAQFGGLRVAPYERCFLCRNVVVSCAKCFDRQKITRQIRVHKLEDMFFSVKVSEPVQPQVEQRGPLGLHLIGQRCCRQSTRLRATAQQRHSRGGHCARAHGPVAGRFWQ